MIWYEAQSKDRAEKKPVYYVVCVNIFDRFIYVARTFRKEPEDILLAIETCLRAARSKPKVVSSDNEFTANKIKEFFQGEGIQQRFKEVGDKNSLGVVDRAIQLIKGKLTESQWNTNKYIGSDKTGKGNTDQHGGIM